MPSLRPIQILHGQRPICQAYLRRSGYFQISLLTTTATRAANPNSEASQTISEVANHEGGPYKGSRAAQLQSEESKARNAAQDDGVSTQADSSSTNRSQLDRKANYEAAAEKVGTKLANDPAAVSKEDGDLLHSREVRAFGESEKGGLASRAQSQAAENMGVKKTTDTAATHGQQSKGGLDPRLLDAAKQVLGKMDKDPKAITKEDGSLMHSQETRTDGAAKKGGPASQVQSQAAENMGPKK